MGKKSKDVDDKKGPQPLRRLEGYALYRDERLTLAAIARRVGVTRQTTSTWCKEDNWKERRESDTKAKLVQAPVDRELAQKLKEIDIEKAKLETYLLASKVVEEQRELDRHPDAARDDRVVLMANKQRIEAIQLIEGKHAGAPIQQAFLFRLVAGNSKEEPGEVMVNLPDLFGAAKSKKTDPEDDDEDDLTM